MKVWIDSLLFTARTPLKAEYLKIIDPFLILDLRKRTERSHWYEGTIKTCECISLEIESGKCYYDTGRAVKDKHATIKKICRKMVNYLKEKKAVLIVCYDGVSASGYLAMIVKWWYQCLMGQVSKDVDYILEARRANDFDSAKSKEQREQMVQIKEEALGIMRWEGFVTKS
jgi:hypothetical protein